MSLKTRISENWESGVIGALLCAGLGILLWLFPLGDGLAHLSYDLGFLFRPPVNVEEYPFDDTLIVYMDETALTQFELKRDNWDRKLHAQLVDRLTRDGAKLVVFDVWFTDPGETEDNQEFAQAMRDNGKVVLAAHEDKGQTSLLSINVTMPPPDFADVAADWGLAGVLGDKYSIVRRYVPGNTQADSLPMAAFKVAGLGGANAKPDDLRGHWLNYYYSSSGSAIDCKSYTTALVQPAGYFSNKLVFVGWKSTLGYGDQPVEDMFRTPRARWNGELMPGVEIAATAFLNLAQKEWLTRLSWPIEGLLVTAGGLVFGFLLGLIRPVPAVGIAVIGFIGVVTLSIAALWQTHVWWAWMWVAAGQIPLALCWSVLAQTRRLKQQKEDLEHVIASSLTAASGARHATSPQAGTGMTTPASLNGSDVLSIQIPDHKLLKIVGRGSYGEVWLAHNAIGLYRAVKLVRRNEFSKAGPYEREFNGIRNFMPITLQHPGLLHLLHVGRNDEEGYFYSIMETADDETAGTQIDPARYSPKTLATVLKNQRILTPREMIPIVLELTSALDFLHRQRLIHRDIKPSNIIFAGGIAKLADIGLVTAAASGNKGVTIIGTAGYMAPEGPGTPAADLYSLGKVLYESVFCREPDLFPELPTGLDGRGDYEFLMEFNRIIGKACHSDAKRRYQSAEEIREEMQQLRQRMNPA